MEKTIYDESNELWYELRGDYYIPCLAVPAQDQMRWAQRMDKGNGDRES